jgi:integrase
MLHREQVDREQVTYVFLPTTKTGLGKAFVFRQPEALALLARLTRGRDRLDGPLFSRRGRPIPYSTFWRHWVDACERAGLPSKHPHDYRRAIYDTLLPVVDEETAMMWVGHEHRDSMSRYNVMTLRRLVWAADQLTASEDPRRTRAGEARGGTVSPL